MNEQEKAFRKDLKELLKKHGVEIEREDTGRGDYHADYVIEYYQPPKWEDGVKIHEGFEFVANYLDGDMEV